MGAGRTEDSVLSIRLLVQGEIGERSKESDWALGPSFVIRWWQDRSHINMPAVRGKAAPSNAISVLVYNLCFAPLDCQVQLAIVGVDTMLHFGPDENLDGLVVHEHGLAVFGHKHQIEGGGAMASSLVCICS